MSQYHSTAKLKDLALSNARRYRAEYTIADAENAYNYAVARCGFSNPEVTDVEYVIKQFWLLEAMNLYFYYDIDRQYLLRFDVEGLKLSQAAKNIKETIKDLERALEKAKTDTKTAHLFIDAEEYFAGTVVDTGLQDDAVGQDTREE